MQKTALKLHKTEVYLYDCYKIAYNEREIQCLKRYTL